MHKGKASLTLQLGPSALPGAVGAAPLGQLRSVDGEVTGMVPPGAGTVRASRHGREQGQGDECVHRERWPKVVARGKSGSEGWRRANDKDNEGTSASSCGRSDLRSERVELRKMKKDTRQVEVLYSAREGESEGGEKTRIERDHGPRAGRQGV